MQKKPGRNKLAETSWHEQTNLNANLNIGIFKLANQWQFELAKFKLPDVHKSHEADIKHGNKKQQKIVMHKRHEEWKTYFGQDFNGKILDDWAYIWCSRKVKKLVGTHACLFFMPAFQNHSGTMAGPLMRPWQDYCKTMAKPWQDHDGTMPGLWWDHNGITE